MLQRLVAAGRCTKASRALESEAQKLQGGQGFLVGSWYVSVNHLSLHMCIGLKSSLPSSRKPFETKALSGEEYCSQAD